MQKRVTPVTTTIQGCANITRLESVTKEGFATGIILRHPHQPPTKIRTAKRITRTKKEIGDKADPKARAEPKAKSTKTKKDNKNDNE